MRFWERAFELAEKARGLANPNPAVGAVLVRDGRIVGEGFTQPPGGPHAEAVALAAAGPLARDAVMYVTLEPCSHWGRTPPCAVAIAEAGVRSVHAAILDPSPWVNGKGRDYLEQSGVVTRLGRYRDRAARLNEGYFKLVASGSPFVTAKFAMTLDGRIATRTGSSQYVSSPEARDVVARMRFMSDAVMVGVGTILADDPQLTARGSAAAPGHALDSQGLPPRQPLRVVLDTSLRIPLQCRAVAGGLSGKTLVITTEKAPEGKRRALEEKGVEVLVVGRRRGRVDLRAALGELAQRNVASVLAESGGTLLASLLDEGLVDKVVAFIAPKLVGGAAAPGPIGGKGVEAMADAIPLYNIVWSQVGPDLMVTGYLRPSQA